MDCVTSAMFPLIIHIVQNVVNFCLIHVEVSGIVSVLWGI